MSFFASAAIACSHLNFSQANVVPEMMHIIPAVCVNRFGMHSEGHLAEGLSRHLRIAPQRQPNLQLSTEKKPPVRRLVELGVWGVLIVGLAYNVEICLPWLSFVLSCA